MTEKVAIDKQKLDQLFKLLDNLCYDIHDRDSVIDWLTFICCPRTETSNFCMTEFLENQLTLFPIVKITDLVADLRAELK